jgi:hypothetical protein
MDGAKSARLVSLAVAVCAALACSNTAAPAGSSGTAGTSGAPGAAAGTTGTAGAVSGSDAAAGVGAPITDASLDADVAPVGDGPNKTIVLSVGPSDGMPLASIAKLEVTVMENGSSRLETFPYNAVTPLNASTPLKLGVVVEPSDSGMVIIIVDALDASGCKLATALVNVVLLDQAVIEASAALARLDDCAAADGGADAPAPVDGGPALFPGCDPIKTACGAGMTCEVRCAAKAAACTAGGSGFHGTTCATSADCAAGSECVDYAAAGCAVKLCRRFCGEDVNCPQPISAALPRNACAVPLACGATPTAYRTCSVSCDPTFATRANGDSSCPEHLDCVLLDPDHADCACAPRAGGKAEGATCDVTADCAHGLVCNLMGATKTCRAICRCNVENGACAAVIDGACPKAGTHCAPLTGGTVFGVCVP